MQTKKLHRRLRSFWMVSGAALILFFVVDYFGYPYGTSAAGVTGNEGENGLWLHSSWYFGQHTAQEETSLAKRLNRQQIRYAYFHVRFINRDGALQYRFPASSLSLTKTVRHMSPLIKVIAWIYAGNAHGAGAVDLANAAVRQKMVREARCW